MILLYVLFVFGVVVSASGDSCTSSGVWTWQCKQERCVKAETTAVSPRVELNTCKLTCGKYSMLFPKPSGYTSLGKNTVPFVPIRVKLDRIRCLKGVCSHGVKWLINNAYNVFQRELQTTYNKVSLNTQQSIKCTQEAQQREVRINLILQSDVTKLTIETDESYSLKITTTTKAVVVAISAKTFFGARHGLETVSQLTAYSESHDALQIVSEADIRNDKPAYPYRGLLLDTSRNFFSVDNIMRLISAMSYNKMNTLHWHITDTHSFPIEIKSQPEMLQYGAYSPRHVYTHKDIRKIVDHAKVRGVRVMPEFDEPAHCGEGWQWGPKAGLGNLAVCVNKEPWQKYCVEPPCGQLNPTNDNVYDVLAKIYKEYLDLFDPDLFHAGGDEININCWNTTKEITDWLKTNYGGVTEKNFMDMWGMFLKKSSDKLYKEFKGKDLPMILWTSKMTTDKYLTKYLDPKKHIIQIWTGTKNGQIADIVQNGFRTIFSTYDTLYLDCGYGNWLVKGNNWCSPYKDWKLLYENDPVKILQTFGVTVTDQMRKTILGQEAAMWSEQVDGQTSEGKIWPRTAALAERLWSNPKHDWRGAEYRLIFHRERMIERGIQADALQPLWCEQNAGHCYYDPNIKGEH
ncbi:chitooligosaccharidolytic beta-N-acetylglucosaminidase-like [Hydractinia symbiolongicarpus]|uniref:chitooligosaccharidolytic beta-N-acetylglucosaminidase-like n=1 Tax=Hydractinia symbiolongicarpus TaxID=13093 RepID=UPI00254E7D0A|nr:chitooligosaccharidolytic beta-N-acetylglucosaminidase-like [Hydractinia symbiolongicarpus]